MIHIIEGLITGLSFEREGVIQGWESGVSPTFFFLFTIHSFVYKSFFASGMRLDFFYIEFTDSIQYVVSSVLILIFATLSAGNKM